MLIAGKAITERGNAVWYGKYRDGVWHIRRGSGIGYKARTKSGLWAQIIRNAASVRDLRVKGCILVEADHGDAIKQIRYDGQFRVTGYIICA